jgi:hypothetical protein
MYFPYLYGKQNELLAVKELQEFIITNGKIIPIFEPVSLSSTLKNVVKDLNEKKLKFVVVINPIVGSLVNKEEKIIKELVTKLPNNESVSLAFHVNYHTNIEDIEKMIKRLEEYSFSFIIDHEPINIEKFISLLDRIKTDYLLINTHLRSRELEKYKSFTKIQIEDPFIKQQKNSQYPPESIFKSLCMDFKNEGFEGFGDYQMVGKEYSDSGGPAYAVALHLLSIDENGQLIMKHFLSDDQEGPGNVQGKYFEALKKLINYVDLKNSEPETIGIKNYRENYEKGAFPGLGMPKRYSIKHHIEYISKFI